MLFIEHVQMNISTSKRTESPAAKAAPRGGAGELDEARRVRDVVDVEGPGRGRRCHPAHECVDLTHIGLPSPILPTGTIGYLDRVMPISAG